MGFSAGYLKNTSKSTSPSDLQGQRQLSRLLTPGLKGPSEVFMDFMDFHYLGNHETEVKVKGLNAIAYCGTQKTDVAKF